MRKMSRSAIRDGSARASGPMRWVDVRTSTYVQGMPDEFSRCLGADIVTRKRVGRCNGAVCPSMIDRDEENAHRLMDRSARLPHLGQSHDR
jgi:hypothetical protein